jgi:hypothetical protein
VMGHENYCIWSGSSIGGCPLEETSEQERIPSIIGSIIGSIVWCCPTSRVSIIMLWFSILFFESLWHFYMQVFGS